jgi:hypothetical protein
VGSTLRAIKNLPVRSQDSCRDSVGQSLF